MNPFLRQVAAHYFRSGDISSRCFVFPNRRSMIFFKKWLCDIVAEEHGRPMVAPRMMTVNDFFYKVSNLSVTDKVTLLIELYECYCRLNKHHESLDEFIFWGDVILSDFNDVDKYLADPKQLFANISDFKAIQDTYSYLTDVQRAAIESFVSHFNDRNGRLTVDISPESDDVKGKFLQIWNILYPLYMDFNVTLRDKGMAYEGMVYRTLAESLGVSSADDVLKDFFPEETSFVFVGLNALNECEKTLMRRLRDCSRAEFCWDWTGDMIRDRNNRSSFFMASNHEEFPPAFEPEGLSEGCRTSFNTLSVPSAYGQVKHLAPVLEKLSDIDPDRLCTDTAVILPDESLLVPVLNSIPETIKDVNVTMGYPMAACELSVLMADIARLQMHLRKKGGVWYFYHKPVWDILSSGLIKSLLAKEDMEECRKKVTDIRLESKFYISQEDLSGENLLDLIFRPIAVDLTSTDPAQTDALAAYLQQVIVYLAPIMSKDPDMALDLEFARKYYSSINSLRARKLSVQPQTFTRLLDSLMSGLTVPFKGEPLKGLQIMGPLETRALDFRNVIILSCNEGMFPRRNVSSSFVPPELRKAFGLPTYEFQDAIWAYYFYRLVSRAENVWMIYDSRTEGLKRGEESRYIKQLKYHFGMDVTSYVADSELTAGAVSDEEMEKTDEMMKVISDMTLSVSALQNYVICPMKFCYHSVLKLKKDEEVSESLDNAMIGNVYHNTMWALYYGNGVMESDGPFEKLHDHSDVGMPEVSADYIKSWLARKEDINEKVKSLMKAEINSDEISGRDLVVQRVIVRYVIETLKKDLMLLEKYSSEAFDIIGLEKKLYVNLYGTRFFGVVDRIDSISKGMVRLTDYKSGNDSPSVIDIPDSKAETALYRIFDDKYSVKKANKAAIQFHIYDRMAEAAGLVGDGDMVCNSMYATSDLFKNVPPVYPMGKKFASLMDERLNSIISQIKDVNVPFRRTDDEDACRFCDFKMICGR